MKIIKIFLLMVLLGAISGIYAEDTTIYVNSTHYWYQSGLFVESNNSIEDAIENVPENGTIELTTDLNISVITSYSIHYTKLYDPFPHNFQKPYFLLNQL